MNKERVLVILSSIINKIPLWAKQIMDFVGYCSICLFISFNICTFLNGLGYESFFVLVPTILWIIVVKFRNVFKYSLSINISLLVSVINTFVIYCGINIPDACKLYVKHKYEILTSLLILFLLNLFVSVNYIAKNKSENLILEKSDLFNILYVNISKVHEIAMLIDNKIMKTIEKEQVSEELLKSSYSLGISSNIATTDTSVQKEDNFKKRVYENFDVKTTKSIMLRRLYDVINKNSKSNNEQNKNLKTGQLIIFKDIALKRRNLDDTVMILNVLQDSKIKNQGDDNIEINMNRMMEKMLDDFTIDYVFEQNWDDESISKYIFQLPYKSNDNFENGYQHNDLQLGTLSIIGIYRGEIDFSKRDSASSKFLEMLSDSYNNPTSPQNEYSMQMSIEQENYQLQPFEFKHNKLTEKIHLIDVIAIIQELTINEEA